MISIDDVKACIAGMGCFTSAELEQHSSIIENATSVISDMILDESMHSNGRAVYLAAARANLDIALVISSADRVTSFKAGDVSITESADSSSASYARELYATAKNDCADLISDDGFAFLGV